MCIKLIICALNVFPIPFVPKNLETEVSYLSLFSNKKSIELLGSIWRSDYPLCVCVCVCLLTLLNTLCVTCAWDSPFYTYMLKHMHWYNIVYTLEFQNLVSVWILWLSNRSEIATSKIVILHGLQSSNLHVISRMQRAVFILICTLYLCLNRWRWISQSYQPNGGIRKARSAMDLHKQ